jgi:GNAT superfamily N-acetyltransferase
MEGFSFRPVSFDDINIVHQLITQQNILDFGEPLRTVEDIQRIWSAPIFHLAMDTQLAIAPNGQAAGYAELRDKEDLSIYLSRDHQTIELSNHLLEFLTNRARSQKTETAPVELWGQVGFRNQVLVDMYESNGFTSDISFLVMEIEMLETPQVPQWPEGIQVRTFVKGQDDQVTYQTDEEAAKDKGYHAPLSFEKWALRMGMDKLSFDPDIWFLARDKEEIAGVVLNVLNQTTQVGWVDHLSVRREWRNKGIGKALLLHTFGEFFRRGIHTIKLSVDSKSLTNAPRLYESVGMKTVQKYYVYKKVI